MIKRKYFGFTLMEMTLSMGLWVMLLGTFMASLFFRHKEYDDKLL